MRKRKWLRWILVLVVLLLAASVGFSRVLQTNAARRYLLAHLVASFGRPVDVGRFDFSLLDGARLEADSVTVAEDPHFGNEYFLRAETLTAGLRWSALFSGRFEFGSLSLLRPSLNLTRDASGHWNIERWLPPASSGASRPGFVGPLAAPPVARLHRIQVDSGRINFKQLDDKSPFALRDVSGQVEQDSAGRWQLDLEARPMRAGVELQDIGTLRLRGTIAGTSARLQPAELNLTWRDASLADALRLARQVDYGMRGELSMDLSAKIGPPEPASLKTSESSAAQWSISGVARLTGIHGWMLPSRETDPAANISLEAAWQSGEPRAQIRNLLVEMASTHLQATGDLDWGQGFHPQFHIESSSLGLNDVLSWYRSLHPGVAESLRAQGALGLDVTFGGWPIELQKGAIASVGGTLTGASLPAALEIGAMNASVSSAGLDFAPTELFFDSAPLEELGVVTANMDDSPSTFRLRGSILPESNGVFRWPLNWNLSIEGATPRAQDWLVLSETLAQPLNKGWTAAGGLEIKMLGTRKAESPAPIWLGTMDFHGITVSPEHVNQPVRLTKAHVEFTTQQRTVTLSAAEAFGAAWHGTISRKNSDRQWTFDLSADHLDSADLDRWLGPRARPSFLARFTRLGAAASTRSEDDTMITQIMALGSLHVGEIVLAPMRLENFDGEMDLEGRTIRIRKGRADFFGGKVEGKLDARLIPDPAYEFQGSFERVNLVQLGRGVPFLNNRIAGTTSATLSLAAHGIGRRNLIASMEGNGTLNAKKAELPGMDLTKVFPVDDPGTSSDVFTSVTGAFRIHAAGIDLANFVLDQSRGRLQVEGRITFSHTLNVRISPSILQAASSPAAASPPGFLLTGTIEDPKLTLPTSAPKPSARFGSRGR
jgi:AsmA-like C-terminal region/AsmA family